MMGYFPPPNFGVKELKKAKVSDFDRELLEKVKFIVRSKPIFFNNAFALVKKKTFKFAFFGKFGVCTHSSKFESFQDQIQINEILDFWSKNVFEILLFS